MWEAVAFNEDSELCGIGIKLQHAFLKIYFPNKKANLTLKKVLMDKNQNFDLLFLFNDHLKKKS